VTNKEPENFDLDGLVIPESVLAAKRAARATSAKPEPIPIKKPKRVRATTGFTMITDPWRDRLKAAKHIATLRVALYLLRYHSKYPDQLIPLSNMALKEWGVSRDQKRRAIPELESLGLIQVEQRGKASALAKLLL
jgi:hypothetical protein